MKRLSNNKTTKYRFLNIVWFKRLYIYPAYRFFFIEQTHTNSPASTLHNTHSSTQIFYINNRWMYVVYKQSDSDLYKNITNYTCFLLLDRNSQFAIW